MSKRGTATVGDGFCYVVVIASERQNDIPPSQPQRLVHMWLLTPRPTLDSIHFFPTHMIGLPCPCPCPRAHDEMHRTYTVRTLYARTRARVPHMIFIRIAIKTYNRHTHPTQLFHRTPLISSCAIFCPSSSPHSRVTLPRSGQCFAVIQVSARSTLSAVTESDRCIALAMDLRLPRCISIRVRGSDLEIRK